LIRLKVVMAMPKFIFIKALVFLLMRQSTKRKDIDDKKPIITRGD
jgi:hypothetical protein